MTEHYITYYVPGSLFAEDYVEQIPERTIEAALAVIPDHAFAFDFFDRVDPTELPAMPEGYAEPKRIPINKSHRYYPGGKVMNAEAVRAWGDLNNQDTEILRSNMQANRWDRIVLCRTGNWQPLEDGEVIEP